MEPPDGGDDGDSPMEAAPSRSRDSSDSSDDSSADGYDSDRASTESGGGSDGSGSGSGLFGETVSSMSMSDSTPPFYDEPEPNYDNIETPAILLRRRPSHAWSVVGELRRRESGLMYPPGRCGNADLLFERNFYGSLHSVSRLELMYKLKKHKGCVNSINFHPEGHLLASGSDDLGVVVWDWATNTVRRAVKTEHKSNIFQSRFLHLSSSSQLDIVTSARDGQVRLLQLPSSGGPPMKRLLAEHSRPVHKLYTNAAEPHVVVSAGEDGAVTLSDVREEKSNRLLVVLNGRKGRRTTALYSVSGHPLDVNQMCVSGRSRHVMIYDRRKAGPEARPAQTYCPEVFRDVIVENRNPSSSATRNRKSVPTYVTCAVYNHNGTEILASYNDDDIYLFDTVQDCHTSNGGPGFTYLYSGHRNSDTFKGVSFFGPQSEFVVSGSDCANIYIWDKKTQTIVQWMMGDENGVVNCIECHPRFPIMATSGLDKDVKIWVPSNESDPKLTGLKEVVIKNSQDRLRRPLFPRFSIFEHVSNTNSDSEGADNDDSQPDGINAACRAF